jgi:uncharacterized OsmC-like protein
VVCDQPRDNAGGDNGMTPPEFLLVSLGTCAGYYAAEYLKTRKLPVEGLRVQVTAEKVRQPARLGSFKITVEAPSVTGEHHRYGLLRAAKSCLIHNTLLHPPTVEMEVSIEAPAVV